jgi:hypothetical protein
MGRGPSAGARHHRILGEEDIVPLVEPWVRPHQQRTDRALSGAYQRLADDARATAVFSSLLDAARRRARGLFHAPIDDGRHDGIDALVRLARAADGHLRPVDTWPGSDGSWFGVVQSLSRHMAAAYPVPAFLAGSWYAADDRYGDAQRRWFVEHGGGRPFRSLDLPFTMTRQMEHLFLRSPAHLSVPFALRRAELLGLGAEPRLVSAILAARPALELDHGDFWRTAWTFLIANAHAIDIGQVGPLVDFFHGVRHERLEVDTAAGLELRDPPEPGFSLKGRTVRSVVRLMTEWHRSLGRGTGRMEWAPSALRPMTVEVPAIEPEAPPTRWDLVELTSAALLRAEGAALKHCVASYGRSCVSGRSRIWSLRRCRDGEPRSVLTIEVDPRRRAIVQVRGLYNRAPAGRSLEIVRTWARREQLTLSL